VYDGIKLATPGNPGGTDDYNGGTSYASLKQELGPATVTTSQEEDSADGKTRTIIFSHVEWAGGKKQEKQITLKVDIASGKIIAKSVK